MVACQYAVEAGLSEVLIQLCDVAKHFVKEDAQSTNFRLSRWLLGGL
jgi:hypothetical protein